jgi:hypothetical protein
MQCTPVTSAPKLQIPSKKYSTFIGCSPEIRVRAIFYPMNRSPLTEFHNIEPTKITFVEEFQLAIASGRRKHLRAWVASSAMRMVSIFRSIVCSL